MGVLSLKVCLHFCLILFFILPLVSCPLWGQEVQKKDLTPQDYHLWGTMNMEKISPDSQWITYTMGYEKNVDTLFVQSTRNQKTYAFSTSYSSQFTKDAFVSMGNKGLEILDLKTGKKQSIPLTQQYSYSALTDLLILTVDSPDAKKKLLIQNPNGKIVREITDVTDFLLSPDKQHLIYGISVNNKHSVMLLDLRELNHEKFLVINNPDTSFGFTWHKNGKAVAFVLKSDLVTSNSLFYYILQNDKLYQMNPAGSSLAKNTFIPADPTLKLTISDDLQRVFFTTKIYNAEVPIIAGSDVEVWNANDKSLYLKRKKDGNPDNFPRVALWIPTNNLVTAVTSKDFPQLMLSGDQKYAFLFNQEQYEPQIFTNGGPSDVYIMNLQTFDKKRILERHSTHFFEMIPSPSGKYLAYYKDGNWWTYNIATESHQNITATVKTKFTAFDVGYSLTGKNNNAGWSVDDNEILLYDEYDLWDIKPDGSAYRRLTKGRELNISYRLVNSPGRNKFNFIYNGLTIDNFDLNKELFLHGQGDDGKTGYFKWNKNLGESPITYKDSHLDQLIYTTEKKDLFYREQKFDLSPRIMMKQNKSDAVVLFQSNKQQKKYYWGKSELIEYQNSKGIKMKGVLRYPANYDPAKKYPMIVHIYQIKNELHHKYENPTSYTEEGENGVVWTSQGYFFLQPDIIIEADDPGMSALDCVTSAVEKVISKDIINPKKIGLTGFSFGGYESTFIITQSNLFAAAAPGAGVSDLNSFYFTLAKDFYLPNIFRYFNGQWKMTKSPFEAAAAYQRNSPIVHAHKVTTPVLLYAGTEDHNIDPHQTTEFYFALRSMNKKCIMLLYPQEGHSFSKAVNQKDLTDRMQQWFAYYLKDDLSAEWITEGVK
ncbi:prolyl oligopeptidase family protein [Flavobacterium sp. 9]|uniref:S9 family peptidase n=1 Tax=Flavobacterium sp. 9 TaxID=2035198 RepID=UPI000C40CB6E|nr:prolyl oligopeptidase family serine peptidase [Flavobacterium sp. 9]PIF34527.1 prolyl oligopeptidase family protein [Flavobacterium sp. 9]